MSFPYGNVVLLGNDHSSGAGFRKRRINVISIASPAGPARGTPPCTSKKTPVIENILEVRELVKRYPNVTAVDGLSFSVREGICFGLLGPNGAGKTTTIEIMEGILQP